jgi:protein gp37
MTHIQWTNETINFWLGCQKVGDGCKFCYMYRNQTKYGKDPTQVVRVSHYTNESKLAKLTKPSMIFTCSYSDFFIDKADQWREEAWNVIRAHPEHVWQILTKRPERIMDCLPEDWGMGWDNVWLGVSIESQKYLDRAYTLEAIPAKTRFISAEPLLSEIDFSAHQQLLRSFHWCIIGGESGDDDGEWRYRECKMEWIEKIIHDMHSNNNAVFVKQLGTHLAKQMNLSDQYFGGNILEWPINLQVREWPLSLKGHLARYNNKLKGTL